MKRLSRLMGALALLLSHAMCAVVAWEYCSLMWCGKYGLCSAPASTALLYSVPFLVGIGICMLLAWYFRRHSDSGDGR